MSETAKFLLDLGLTNRAAERVSAIFTTIPRIAGATTPELIAAGATPKAAARVVAALAASKEVLAGVPFRTTITSPEDAWRLLRTRAAGLCQEIFWCIPIDIRNGVLDVIEVARGSVTGVEVHPREVFRPAIRLAAAGILIAHNHPSDDPTPSHDDIMLTKRLRQAGEILGVPVVDHVVVCSATFRSISEWCGSEGI